MKNQTRTIARCALFTALTAVMSQLILPLQPVPFSLSLIAVFLTGALLDKKDAFWAQVAFLLLGAAGAPVFSGFTGGLGKLAGPTGGYLLAYPLMAFAVAWITEKWGRQYYQLVLSMCMAMAICYGLGTAWLAVSTKTTFASAAMLGVAPFMWFDFLKALLSSGFAVSLEKALRRYARGYLG